LTAELRIIAHRGDAEADVTEAVTKLYDLMVDSMDWGSGFLDAEDVAHIRAVQDACGFEFRTYQQDKCDTCRHPRQYHRHDVPGDTHCWQQDCSCTAFLARWDIRALERPSS
jgi:hypothetical protein